ncbi:hypothetical protein [Olleya sp. HaHaR_3_96]|uniref:hypothetical protein n=1 Tax=Olleya sp. HaHaR_3_96 TaxID=2745560 RepID=UPI001C4F00CA|nr:hypothetical protein [Olleya sp. HaHaR_3_96]QXP58499.1 hypothetical protein H0I26_11265 [Olleya sp. HaHaR_3_96]
METFLRQNYGAITHGVELLAVLVGLFCYKKFRLTAARYFIFFLLYVFTIDLIGEYPNFYDQIEWLSIIRYSKFHYNYWLFTVFYILGSILFFMFYYSKILKNKTYQTTVIIIGSVNFIIAVIYIVFNIDAFFIKFLPLLNVLACISILVGTIFYFIELLQSNKILNFYIFLDFYISIALFFWWIVTTPVIFYGVYNSFEDLDFVLLKWQIFLFSNVLMYLIFAFGLLISKTEK